MKKNILLLLLLASATIFAYTNLKNTDIVVSDNLDSPKALPIKRISWGKIEVEDTDGAIKTFKDCKIYPGVVKNWDWRQTGTQHVPGINKTDFLEFIDKVDIIILSRGMDCVLQTKPETIEFLKKINKEFYIEQTEKAVELYNKLIKEGKKVGALIHSTC